jgi:hypothetical protein
MPLTRAQAIRDLRTAHRIADLSFSFGWISCTCGETIHLESPISAYRLADAWAAHRRAVGAPAVTVAATIGKRLNAQ